eukprot:c15840_g1_i2 orf=472-1461(-)
MAMLPTQQQLSAQNNAVKGIQELVEAGLTHVPRNYIRPAEERPCLSLVSDKEQVPIINLTGFYGENRERLIQEIGRACEEWGFFQVIGHGVTPSVIENFWAAAINFFQLPPDDKLRFLSEDVRSEVAYITSHNRTKEKVAEWKDTLYFRRLSGVFNGFKQAPEMCREAVLEYMKEITILANAIYKAIFLSLGLSSDYLQKTLPEFQRIVLGINYYPPCPDPDLTFGISGHSDITCLTILTQNDVPGLQVMKNGKWVAVKPVPGSFVVNLGDQTEVRVVFCCESIVMEHPSSSSVLNSHKIVDVLLPHFWFDVVAVPKLSDIIKREIQEH